MSPEMILVWHTTFCILLGSLIGHIVAHLWGMRRRREQRREQRRLLSPTKRFRKTTVVCLSGKAGAGKDTAADMLVAEHDFIKMGFADALRNVGLSVAQVILGYPEATIAWFTHRGTKEVPFRVLRNYFTIELSCQGRTVTEFFADASSTIPEAFLIHSLTGASAMSPRRLLQLLGTDVLRTHIHDDLWVNKVVQDIQDLARDSSRNEDPLRVVISDCRFPNEINMIRRMPFLNQSLAIRLEDPHRDSTVDSMPPHPSETALDHFKSFDATIQNDKRFGPRELRSRVVHELNTVGGMDLCCGFRAPTQKRA